MQHTSPVISTTFFHAFQASSRQTRRTSWWARSVSESWARRVTASPDRFGQSLPAWVATGRSQPQCLALAAHPGIGWSPSGPLRLGLTVTDTGTGSASAVPDCPGASRCLELPVPGSLALTASTVLEWLRLRAQSQTAPQKGGRRRWRRRQERRRAEETVQDAELKIISIRVHVKNRYMWRDKPL